MIPCLHFVEFNYLQFLMEDPPSLLLPTPVGNFCHVLTASAFLVPKLKAPSNSNPNNADASCYYKIWSSMTLKKLTMDFPILNSEPILWSAKWINKFLVISWIDSLFDVLSLPSLKPIFSLVWNNTIYKKIGSQVGRPSNSVIHPKMSDSLLKGKYYKKESHSFIAHRLFS